MEIQFGFVPLHKKRNRIMAKKNLITTADYLPYEEYERLLSCLNKDKYYIWELYARLSFCTACRVSDVKALRWAQVLNKSFLKITEQKTGKTRNISFNDSVKKKIAELYKALGEPDVNEYIFKSDRTDNPITLQFINKMLKKFKEKYRIKIGNFSTHTFRKTFGRYVYEINGRSAESLVLLNKILNHSRIEVTKAYIGITQDEVNRIFDSIRF